MRMSVDIVIAVTDDIVDAQFERFLLRSFLNTTNATTTSDCAASRPCRPPEGLRRLPGCRQSTLVKTRSAASIAPESQHPVKYNQQSSTAAAAVDLSAAAAAAAAGGYRAGDKRRQRLGFHCVESE